MEVTKHVGLTWESKNNEARWSDVGTSKSQSPLV